MCVFMKNIYVVAILVMCVVCVGCNSAGGKNLIERQQSITGATVTWMIDGCKYSADITLDTADDTYETEGYIPSKVIVTSPESISGMTVTYSGDNATAEVGDVSLPLPDNMGKEIYRIVRSLRPDPDDRKGAGSGTGTTVLYETELFDGITSFDITYGDDKYLKSAIITWDAGEMSVEYTNIIADNTVTENTAG